MIRKLTGWPVPVLTLALVGCAAAPDEPESAVGSPTPDAEEERASPVHSLVTVDVNTGTGTASTTSGVITTAEGHVLTVAPLLLDSDEATVTVTLLDGEVAEAEFVAADPHTELAVLQVIGVSDVIPARFGPADPPQPGDEVLRFEPAGPATFPMTGEVTGPVAMVGSVGGFVTDIPTSPGEAGLPIFNPAEEIAGILLAGHDTGDRSGSVAMPAALAQRVAEELRADGVVRHPYLGVELTPAEGNGAQVNSALPGSPGDQAGLLAGDLITGFGDHSVAGPEDVVAAVQRHQVEDTVPLTYERDGSDHTATVTLQARPDL